MNLQDGAGNHGLDVPGGHVLPRSVQAASDSAH
jgi:hypothetical protein